MTSYTDRAEAALFEWDFDNYDDYSELIDILNSEYSFRTFGDGVLSFLQKRNPEITADTAAKYIEKLCSESGVPVSDIANKGTFRNWFKVGKRPKKSEDSRESIFALAFALQLTPESTAELFHKVYLDRAFDYRSITDIVCYFCLEKNKSWQDAKRIIGSIDDAEIKVSDNTIYTSQIKSDIQIIEDERALIDYIKNHGHNLEKRNVAARATVQKLLTEVNELAKKESETMLTIVFQKNQKGIEEECIRDKFACYDKSSINFTYEVITNLPVSGEKGTKTFFKNARLPKEIKSRFPEAVTLSKKEPTYEELRKLIILLASYKHWIKLHFNNENPDIEIYKNEIDIYLNDSGFSPIYYGNPYDWLFLFCTLSDNPLDTFREIIAEVLEEE